MRQCSAGWMSLQTLDTAYRTFRDNTGEVIYKSVEQSRPYRAWPREKTGSTGGVLIFYDTQYLSQSTILRVVHIITLHMSRYVGTKQSNPFHPPGSFRNKAQEGAPA